jgi:predicted GNAT family acetyltransferase
MAITVTSTRVPTSADSGYACAKVGFIARNNPADLQAKATQAGFVHQGGNQYLHADGSWLMMDARGMVNRGVGPVQFQGIPGGRRAQAAAAAPQPPPAQNTYQAGGTAQIDRSRPGVPASMRGYGIAQIGIVNAQTAPAVCTRAGFVQSGSTWIHPDGSWVAINAGRVSVGWKGHSLQELPYRNGRGWT